ncbi:MAG: tetratricopeptide repeat protein, partial [Nitrososphaera sp.]
MKIPHITISPRRRLIIVAGIVLLGLFIRQRITRMDERFFFYSSLHSARGLALYLIGDYSGATRAYRAHYKQIYENYLDPADNEWYALMRGDLLKAKELSQKSLQENPSSIHPLLTLGEIALEENAFDEALSLFDKVLKKNKDQFDALLLSSVAYARSRAFEKAIESLNRALRYNRIQSRTTSFLRALEVTGDLTQLPSRERPWCLLAHYHRYLRIFDPTKGRTAIRYAEKAIQAGDRPDDAYLTMGIVHTKHWNTDIALQAFLKAIDVNQKNAEALRWAARTYSKRGDVGNEYRFVRAAYEVAPMDPYYADALHHVVTEKLGDFHQAMALNHQALLKDPNDPESYSRL